MNDQVTGRIKDIAGQAEAKLGDVLGDTQMKVQGAVDSALGKAQETYGKVREKAQEFADEAPEYVDRAREAGKRYAQTGREYADKASETVKTQVQEQPVVTLLGGVAVGFLLGWLVNSRR